MKKFILILGFSSLFGSNSNYIGLGEEGATMFNNIVTVFVNAEDAQPRCLGCRNIRVILDDRIRGLVGVTYSTDVSINLKGQDNRDLNPLFGIYRFPQTAVLSDPIALQLPLVRTNDGISIDKKQKVEIKFWGLKCMNPSIASCKEKIVKKKFEVPATKIANLNSIHIQQAEYPNKKH